jgi:VanZ family protein
MKHKLIFGILFVIWTFLLILLSVWPYTDTTVQQDLSDFRWDYLEHFAFYFILTFLYILWRRDLNYSIRTAELVLFFVAGFIFCWLTEYIQIFIPGRSFNIMDMIYNIAGIFLGIIICYYLLLRLFIKNYIRSKTAL